MNYFTATLIVKKIFQAHDFKIFIRVRLKAVYLKNRLVKVPDQKELVTVTSSFSQKGTSSSSSSFL